MERRELIDRLWRRWTAVTVVVALVVGVAVASPVVADATGDDRGVRLLLDVPDADDEPLTVSAGVGRAEVTRTNGEEVDLDVRRDASTLVRVVDERGRLRAMAPVVDVPGIEFPAAPIDDRSTAAALAFLRPGTVSQFTIVDALVYDAMYSSDALDDAADAVAAVREEGGDPFLGEDPHLAERIDQLLRDVDTILGARAEQLVEDVRATGPPGATAFTGALFERGPLPTACESFDRVEACGTDQGAEDCARRDPDLLIDLDGREGDNVCLAVIEAVEDDGASGTDATGPDRVSVRAVNLSPRWVNLYRADNDGLYPDAVLEPKTWSIPSVDELVADLAELLARYTAEKVWDVLTSILGHADAVEPRSLSDRFGEMLRGYAADRTTSLELTVGTTGAVVTTHAAGLPRTLSADDLTRGRNLMTLGQTAVTEWLLPAAAFALGSDEMSSSRVCSDREGAEEERLTERFEAAGFRVLSMEVMINANPKDVCEAVLSLGSAVVPMLLRWISSDQGFELGDLFGIVGELVTTVYAVAQVDVEGALSDRAGPAARGVIDRMRREGLDVGELGKVVTESLGRIVEELLAQSFDDAALALLDQAIETVVTVMVPGAGWIKALDRILEGADALAPVVEFLVDAYRHDVIDRYRIQPAALTELPDAPVAPFSSGTTPTTTLLVVDASGSMADPAPGDAGVKQDAAADAGAVLLEVIGTDVELGSDHSVGVVSFSDDVKDQLPPTDDFVRVERFLQRLVSDGGTQIDAALGVAFGALEARDGIRKVYLLTDGEVEAGQQQAVLDTYSQLSRVTGISISTVAFAFPDTAEDQFLRRLAETTGGRFDAPSSAFELQQVFVRGRHDDTGEIIEELDGTVRSGGELLTIEVPSRVGDSAAPPAELVVTVLGDGAAVSVNAVDPLGVPVDPERIRVSAGNPTTVIVPSPIPGTWELSVSERRPGDDPLGSPAPRATDAVVAASARAGGGAVLAAEPDDGGRFSMTASVRPGIPVPPAARPGTDRARVAAGAALGLWVLLVLAGAFRLRRWRDGPATGRTPPEVVA